MDRVSAVSASVRFKVFGLLAFVALASVLAHLSSSSSSGDKRQEESSKQTFLAPRNASWSRRQSDRGTEMKKKKTKTTSSTLERDDSCPPPSLYVRVLGAAAARERWAKTLAWRAQHGADDALRRAQTKYHAVKQLYPHYLHGRVRGSGEIVLWELVGALDTAPLRRGELTTDDAFRHFVFVHEFLSAKFDGEETTLVTILDVAGLRFSQVDSLLMKLISSASSVVDNLVPFRATKIYVLNAPSWFSAVWNSGVKRALPSTVRDKVQVLPSSATLADIVEQVPKEYGGDVPLGQHDDELSMLEAVCVLNSGGSLFAADDDDGRDDEGQGRHDEGQGRPSFFAPGATGGGASSQRRRRVPETSAQDSETKEGGRLPEEDDSDDSDEDSTPERRLRSSSSSSGTAKAAVVSPEKPQQQRRLFGFLRRNNATLPQQAHLGKSGQSFYYDHSKQRWVFPEDDADEAETNRRGEDSDDEDEAALVSAIRAATLHKAGVKAWEDDEDDAATRGDDDEDDATTLRAWLQVGCGLTRAARSLVMTTGPVWLLAPASRGGLGLSMTRAAAVCGSACLLVALLAATRASDAVRHMPHKAPLRAYRVATGACALAAAAAPVTVPSFGVVEVLPRDSLAVAFAAILAVTVVAVATQLACASSAASLQFAGRAPFASVAVVADLLGPFLANRLLRPTLGARAAQPYPRDASVGLSVAAAVFTALYLLSLAVYKRVVVDVSAGAPPSGQARRGCAAFLELPARDLQRCVDDAIEAYDEAASLASAGGDHRSRDGDLENPDSSGDSGGGVGPLR